MLKRLRKLWR